MDPVETLLTNAVDRRRVGNTDLATACALAARDLSLDPERVMRAYVRATSPAQEEVIAFLKRDHGSPRLASPLASPAAEFVDHGDGILAHFPDGHTWVIYRDGGFTPLNQKR